MKFCEQCSSKMTKSTATGTTIRFICTSCDNIIAGKPEDTLMAEEYLIGTSTEGHNTYVKNSQYDLAGYRVKKQCPNKDKCKKDYMTLVRVSENEDIVYVCDKCGTISNAQGVIMNI
jgi:DNA-directed RNA polymerase subunit M/transcription elongation factor TFIIS